MGLFNFNFIVPDNGANGTAGSALSLFRVAPVRFGSWFRYSMKQAVLASTLAAKSRPVNFTQMVEADIPALRRYARAVTRDSDIADDIVRHASACAALRASISRRQDSQLASHDPYQFEPQPPALASAATADLIDQGK